MQGTISGERAWQMQGSSFEGEGGMVNARQQLAWKEGMVNAGSSFQGKGGMINAGEYLPGK